MPESIPFKIKPSPHAKARDRADDKLQHDHIKVKEMMHRGLTLSPSLVCRTCGEPYEHRPPGRLKRVWNWVTGWKVRRRRVAFMGEMTRDMEKEIKAHSFRQINALRVMVGDLPDIKVSFHGMDEVGCEEQGNT